MRNGIYRIWTRGTHGEASGIVVLKDGTLFAADRQYAYNGQYRESGGRFTGTLLCTRLYPDRKANVPDRDRLHMRLEGASGREFAQLSGTIDEAPSFTLAAECAYLGEP